MKIRFNSVKVLLYHGRSLVLFTVPKNSFFTVGSNSRQDSLFYVSINYSSFSICSFLSVQKTPRLGSCESTPPGVSIIAMAYCKN